MDSNNFSSIKKLLAEVEKKQAEMQDQQSKAQQQAMEQQQAMVQAEAQAKQDHEAKENELDRINKIELKKMDLAGSMVSDADGNGRRDDIDRARLDVEKEKVAVQRAKS